MKLIRFGLLWCLLFMRAALADDFNAHLNKAVGLMTAGRHQEAVVEYRAALRLQPNQSTLHYNLGALLVQLRREEEASAEFRQATRLNPKLVMAQEALANTLFRLKRYDEAAAEYRKVIQLKPGFTEYYVSLANTLLAQKKTDQVMALYRDLLQKYPGDPSLSVAFAELLVGLKRYDEAKATLQSVLKTFTKHSDSHFLLGRLHARQGRWRDAVTEFEEADPGRLRADYAHSLPTELAQARARATGQLPAASAPTALPMSEAERLGPHRSGVNVVAFSQDGSRVYSSSWDGTIKVWDVRTRRALNTFKDGEAPIIGLAISPDGALVASGDANDKVKLWNAATGQVLKVLKGHRTKVRTLAFSPDGKHLVSAGEDFKVLLWDVAHGKLLHTLEPGIANLSVAISPDGRLLAAGGMMGNIVNLWDAATGRHLGSGEGHAVAFSPDGKYLVSGSEEHSIKLWDLKRFIPPQSGQAKTFWGTKELVIPPQLTKVAAWGGAGNVLCLAFSRDGKLLASGHGDKSIRIWDAGSGRILHTLIGSVAPVPSVAFSPDGKLLASSGGDSTVKIWDVATGKMLASL